MTHTRTIDEIMEDLERDAGGDTEKTAMDPSMDPAIKGPGPEGAGATEQQSDLGAAANALEASKQAPQEADPANMDTNTEQMMGSSSGDRRAQLKSKLQTMAGAEVRQQADADPEAQLNMTQDTDTARAEVGAAGESPAPHATYASDSTAAEILSNLYDALHKEASSDDELEIMKVAEDAVAYGRWIARGFWDELDTLASGDE